MDDIDHTLTTDTSTEGVAALAQWQRTDGPNHWNYGQRLFQAARFVTEMEYQHLVFEEFARKIQPAIRPFHVYNPDVNPAIPAEFAHAVYRFGHSMLDDTVARENVDASGATVDNSVSLLNGFLNPPEFFHNGASTYTPEAAAGAIVMGSSDQTGNELDEFVTETLRNNLLGLPLDLPTINMARAREAGVPPLNSVRRIIHNKTNDAQLAPYTDWSDFGQHLKHPESLVNYVAAYGTHPTIVAETTVAGKRAAARAIVDPLPTRHPAGWTPRTSCSATGTWANGANGVTNTGLDDVDLWVGGLGEVTNLNGGLLGSTFNYVFQNTLENLQDNDRFYYLNRTPGMNLRTQLEGNSFAEMIQRNTTGTHTLKADAFATADCKFQLSGITFPFSGTNTVNADGLPVIKGAGSVNDDPNTDCDENQLLLRKPDGTIQYRAVQRRRPVRHQRPVRVQRQRRRRPRLRRQRQRHDLRRRPATTSSRATAATTSPSAVTATTSSPTSTVPTSSRAAPATTPSTAAPGTTSPWAATAPTSCSAAPTTTRRSPVRATTSSTPARAQTPCSATAETTGSRAVPARICSRATTGRRSSTTPRRSIPATTSSSVRSARTTTTPKVATT